MHNERRTELSQRCLPRDLQTSDNLQRSHEQRRPAHPQLNDQRSWQALGRYGEGANFTNNCGAGFDRAGERYQPPSLNAASNLELADFELLLKQFGHYR